MKVVKPNDKHHALRDELLALMRTKMKEMPAEEILAVLSYTVGQLIALQDQRRFTSAAILDLVAENMEAGNWQAISEVISAGGASN
jgi:hypothetical protein